MTPSTPPTPAPDASSAARTPPIVWSIAGTDPTAGAGIQADLKTFHGLQVYGCTVITAVIAQNTQGVQRIAMADAKTVEAQLDALASDLPPRAIKIGMLGNADIVTVVARALSRLDAYVVCDPVFGSSSGTNLLDPNAIEPFLSRLLPGVDVLTPNIPEAERLCGHAIQSPAQVEQAAATLRTLGAGSVLIKGGHAPGPFVQDYWTNGTDGLWLTAARIDTRHSRGTGCALSSAIAAARAHGLTELDALVLGRMYVNQGLRLAPGLGKGNGPIYHGTWPVHAEDRPWLTATADAGWTTDGLGDASTPL